LFESPSFWDGGSSGGWWWWLIENLQAIEFTLYDSQYVFRQHQMWMMEMN
jgi:hypothetical protein